MKWNSLKVDDGELPWCFDAGIQVKKE